MTEIVLLLVIASQSLFIYFANRDWKSERERLINAIISKSPQEFKELNTASVAQEPPQPVQELSPLSEVSDSDWHKAVLGANESN